MSSREVTVKLGGSGVSFTALLGLLFIGLKLAGVITWSWFWVLCPFWIGLAIFSVFVLIALICFVVGAIIHICLR